MIEAIGIGVVSGVLSSVLILLLATLIRRVFIPWFRSLIYSGVDVSGEWHCIDPFMAQEITINLNQDADSVSGTATFTWNRDYPDESILDDFEAVRTFNVSGKIRDRFLQVMLTHVDRKRIGVNSYLLEVCGDGRTMKGLFTFYSVRSHELDYIYHTLYRDRKTAVRIAEPMREQKRKTYLERMELKEKLRDIEELDDMPDDDEASLQDELDLDGDEELMSSRDND
ncbi:hypothetical protein [Marinobacter qingdaonensis]|uniref:Polyketide cyclase / dehydrase and lipid transport n=1 Tax=Marinobacter qingdaonensis TaxID=3108486 RepID=A0ABU5NWS4_9GAMM|nr:hypothetical protein [Marinobacter sp. ASW11-75]MEA1080263.1 hypothetical protein [Marinobacter sp. ASW11-75]